MPIQFARTDEKALCFLCSLFLWAIKTARLPNNSGRNETMIEILQHLKAHGEQLDTDIAMATGIPLANVRTYLSELAAKREIMVCHSIRFEKDKKIEGISCKLIGYFPPSAPKKKSKTVSKLS
jgi:hypothetical protein